MLIVNADDLGLSRGVNLGIVEAYERGIVTSASLMVRRPASVHAARLVRCRPRLSVGLHVDLGEWELQHGTWRLRRHIVDPEDGAAVEREVSGQLERFVRLMGREPTHLDSHQHAHRRGPARSVLREKGSFLGLSVRGQAGATPFCGDFYGQGHCGIPCPGAISVDRLVAIVGSIPPGVTELGCHPGYPGDLDDPYGVERRRELDTLCHPRVRAAVISSGIQLRSHHPIRIDQEAACSRR